MAPSNGRAPLPAHLALRIALAARELNGVDTGQLLRTLLSVTGEPITEARLARLRLNRLRNRLLSSVDGPPPVLSERQLQRALGLLKGRGVRMPEEPLPAIEPYREGELPDSIRIACTSDGGERLDGSFGSCARFVYQISPSASRLIDLREPGPAAPHEDRHARRAELLHDCQLLYTLSIGGGGGQGDSRRHPPGQVMADPGPRDRRGTATGTGQRAAALAGQGYGQRAGTPRFHV